MHLWFAPLLGAEERKLALAIGEEGHRFGHRSWLSPAGSREALGLSCSAALFKMQIPVRGGGLGPEVLLFWQASLVMLMRLFQGPQFEEQGFRNSVS